MRKLLPTAILGVAALAVLTGCSGAGTGTASGQSVKDACTIAEEQMTSVSAELSSSVTGLTEGDFGAVVKQFDTLETALNGAIDSIGNAEVKTTLQKLATGVAEFGVVMKDAEAAAGDPTKLADIATQMGDSATAIQEAGEELETLCK